MTHAEFKAAWAAMSEPMRERVRAKAAWEHMSLWAVLSEWPTLLDPAETCRLHFCAENGHDECRARWRKATESACGRVHREDVPLGGALVEDQREVRREGRTKKFGRTRGE